MNARTSNGSEERPRVRLEEGRDFAAAAAFPAREGDVGVKRAAFGF